MKVFIHKLHMGSSLPSVVAGTPYYVVHRGTVRIIPRCLPSGHPQLHNCHASGPTQAELEDQPSRAVCGSCHDDVNFATGQNHVT